MLANQPAPFQTHSKGPQAVARTFLPTCKRRVRRDLAATRDMHGMILTRAACQAANDADHASGHPIPLEACDSLIHKEACDSLIHKMLSMRRQR